MKICKLSDVAEIKICAISSERARIQERPTQWLTSANFLKDNTIVYDTSEMLYAPDEGMIIKKEDIIIKRISPTFVNYVDYMPDNIYGGNNLIIISPRSGVCSKYIASFLNEKIQTLSEMNSSGAVMKSIGRNHLAELEIPIVPYETQVIIGELWYRNIELKKMRMRLVELESAKRNRQIIKYVNSYGGKGNGKDNI